MDDSVIAVFDDHNAADAAVKQLSAGGFEMKNLSVVGKGYHTDEKVTGFYDVGDRIKMWGTRGAMWGASGARSSATSSSSATSPPPYRLRRVRSSSVA